MSDYVYDCSRVSSIVDCNQVDIKAGEPLFSNIGSGKPMSILEFSKMWWRRWNAPGNLLVGSLPYRENEVMRYVPEIKMW